MQNRLKKAAGSNDVVRDDIVDSLEFIESSVNQLQELMFNQGKLEDAYEKSLLEINDAIRDTINFVKTSL